MHKNVEKKRVEKSGEKRQSNENSVLNNHTHIE